MEKPQSKDDYGKGILKLKKNESRQRQEERKNRYEKLEAKSGSLGNYLHRVEGVTGKHRTRVDSSCAVSGKC